MSAAAGLAAATCLLLGVYVALVRALRSATSPRRAVPADGGRWQGRPVLSAVVVGTAYSVPILGAVLASAVLSRHLPRPSGWLPTILTWILLFGVSTAVLLLIERLARRLLPLGALLKLSLAFPDQAPRRLSIARRAASVRDLEARLRAARRQGIEDEPARAAETILTLVGALHAHDRRTRGHAERVRALTDLLAEELRLPAHDRDRLRWAALLHDIGKVHVPARILNKPGQPTAHEWHVIRRHPVDGARLAAPLAAWLGDWSLTIAQHHERWDGTGYPYGLQGEAISYGARIVGVADSFDAMTAARSYQRSRSAAAARRELTAEAGRQFDPAVVRAFLNVSIGRVRWALGPLSWVVQVPFVGWVPRAAEGVVAAGSQAAGVVGTAAGAAVIATSAAAGAGASTVPDRTGAPPAVEAAGTTPAEPAPLVRPPGGPASAGSGSGSAAAADGATKAPAPRPSGADGPAGAPPTSAAPPGNGNGNGKAGDGSAPTAVTTAPAGKGTGTSGGKTRDTSGASTTIVPTTASPDPTSPKSLKTPKPLKAGDAVPVPALTTTTAPATTSTTLAAAPVISPAAPQQEPVTTVTDLSLDSITSAAPSARLPG